MDPDLFNQPFVHCGICHRLSDREYPLYLTSCAHTLCSQHIDTKICPICHINNILVIKLSESKELPDEIKMLFQPIPSILENLHNISQFQITGLINQCNYYQNLCEKLSIKCSRQKEVLFQAKQELDSVGRLKIRIAELESQLLDSQTVLPPSPVFSELRRNHRASNTVDLTLEDKQEKSFIRKLKNTNSLRNNGCTMDLSNSEDSGNSNSSSSISNIIAESTQLDMNFTIKKTSDLSQFSSGLPNALNKLRIVKRNHTFNNNSNHSGELVISRGDGTLVTQMKTSKNHNSELNVQANLLMHGSNTLRDQTGSNTQGNNKLRRIR